MNKMGLTAAMGAALMIAGCAGTPDCLKKPRYADAQTFPAMQAPAGLSLPDSDEAMRVPDVRDGPIAAFAQAPAGTDPENPQSRCLATPPPISSTGS